MKNKKRLLLLALPLLLSACGGSKDPTPTPSQPGTPTPSQPATPSEPAVSSTPSEPGTPSEPVEPTQSSPFAPSVPTTPAPTEQTPSTPEPSEVTPSEPTLIPTPTEVTPSEPAPSEVTPTDPTPVVPTPSPSEPTPSTEKYTVAKSISEIADLYDWEDATQYSSFKLDSVVTISSNGGTNTGKYYSNGENYRLYQSENAELVISVSEGHELSSVKVTYTSQKDGILVGLPSGVEKEVSGNRVIYSVGNSSTATNGQARITNIEVTYTGEKGEEIVDPTKRDYWDEDELEFIDTYLYGVEVPFLYIKGAKTHCDTDYYEFNYYSNNSSSSLISQYASLFDEADNWEETYSYDNYYIYRAEVETALGKRYVRAQIYALDDEGYLSDDGTGEFNLLIDDPYYYEWPEDYSSYIAQYFESNPMPVFNGAEFYEIEDYLEYGCGYIYCYGEVSLEEDYAKLLEDNLWEISEDRDAFGYFNAKKEGENYQIDFAYEEDGYLLIIVYENVKEYDSFPLDELKELYGAEFDTPVLNASYYNYKKGVVTAYGVSENDLTTYLSELQSAWGYVELEDDEGNFAGYYATTVSSGVEISLVVVNISEGTYTLTFEETGYLYSKDFPTDAINEFLAYKNITGNVPVLPADEYLYCVTLDSYEYYDCVEIIVEGDNVNAWLNALKDEYTVPTKPTEYGYECINKAKTIEIDVYYSEDEGVTSAVIYSYSDLY